MVRLSLLCRTPCILRRRVAVVPLCYDMSNEPHTKPPFLRLGPRNNGPAVVVTAYVLIIIAILTTLTRVIIARASGRTLTIADGLNIAATVSLSSSISLRQACLISWHLQLLALPQSIAINLAVNHGLGRHLVSVSTSNQASYYKVSIIPPIKSRSTLAPD